MGVIRQAIEIAIRIQVFRNNYTQVQRLGEFLTQLDHAESKGMEDPDSEGNRVLELSGLLESLYIIFKQNEGSYVTLNQLSEAWDGSVPSKEAIRKNVERLREELANSSSDERIFTKSKKGYKLVRKNT